MKHLLTLALTLLVGVLLGFYLGVNQAHLNSVVIAVNNDGGNRVLDETPINKVTKVVKTGSISQSIIDDIKRQDIDKSINALLFSDLTLREGQLVQRFLHDHLLQLNNNKSWQLLESWLLAINSAGLANSLYYRLHAQLLINKTQYQDALEGLMVAHALVTSVQEQQLLMKEAKKIIDITVQHYAKGHSNFSQNKMEAFLVYAKQQLPEYTPVSLALANVYRSNGDLQKSLETLAYLPYDEQYTFTIDELQQSLEAQLVALSHNKNGIKLYPSGSQFLVKVWVQDTEFKLLIDTGASYTAFTNQAVAKLMSTGNVLSTDYKNIKVNTANGTTQARMFTLSEFKLGPRYLTNLSVLEVNMGENSHSDGLLGMNFLSQFKFKIDQENALLFLE
jgi:clan AA aspartic protease (TIGR02281 family)